MLPTQVTCKCPRVYVLNLFWRFSQSARCSYLNPFQWENNTFLLSTSSSCQYQLQQMFVLPNQKQGYLSRCINKQRPEQHWYLTVKTGNSIEALQPLQENIDFSPAMTDADVKVRVRKLGCSWDAEAQADSYMRVCSQGCHRCHVTGMTLHSWVTDGRQSWWLNTIKDKLLEL